MVRIYVGNHEDQNREWLIWKSFDLRKSDFRVPGHTCVRTSWFQIFSPWRKMLRTMRQAQTWIYKSKLAWWWCDREIRGYSSAKVVQNHKYSEPRWRPTPLRVYYSSSCKHTVTCFTSHYSPALQNLLYESLLSSSTELVIQVTKFATSGKLSTWLPMGRLVEQALREEKSNHAHTCQKTWFSDGFENSQGASKSVKDHSRVSPITPGHHLIVPESILVASCFVMFRHSFLGLGQHHRSTKSIGRHGPLGKCRSYMYL